MDSRPDAGEADSSSAVARIPFEVDWPPGHVAAYLVRGEEPILVDAGNPGDRAREELTAGLAEQGVELEDIDHLVLTHGHPDHTGQTPAILGAADPTVYAPAAVHDRLGRDLDQLREAVRRNTTLAGTAPERLDTAIEWAVRDVEFSRDLLPRDAIDVEISAGAPFEAGGVTFEPVHTPGHNAEHHVYLTDLSSDQTGGTSARVAFSGDMAVRTFRAVLMHVGLDDGVREAVPAFQRALDRLADEDVDCVYPGHGPVHQDYLEAIDQSRESLARLLDATYDHLEAGDGDCAVGIARARLDEADARSLGYMLPETVAALAQLERTERARATVDENGVRRYVPL